MCLRLEESLATLISGYFLSKTLLMAFGVNYQ